MCINDEEFNAIKTTVEHATRQDLEKEISDLKKEISNLKLENLKLRGDIVKLKEKNEEYIKKLKKVKEIVEKLKEKKKQAKANKSNQEKENKVDYRAMNVELKKKNDTLERLLKIERAKKGRRV